MPSSSAIRYVTCALRCQQVVVMSGCHVHIPKSILSLTDWNGAKKKCESVTEHQ